LSEVNFLPDKFFNFDLYRIYEECNRYSTISKQIKYLEEILDKIEKRWNNERYNANVIENRAINFNYIYDDPERGRLSIHVDKYDDLPIYKELLKEIDFKERLLKDIYNKYQ